MRLRLPTGSENLRHTHIKYVYVPNGKEAKEREREREKEKKKQREIVNKSQFMTSIWSCGWMCERVQADMYKCIAHVKHLNACPTDTRILILSHSSYASLSHPLLAVQEFWWRYGMPDTIQWFGDCIRKPWFFFMGKRAAATSATPPFKTFKLSIPENIFYFNKINTVQKWCLLLRCSTSKVHGSSRLNKYRPNGRQISCINTLLFCGNKLNCYLI